MRRAGQRKLNHELGIRPAQVPLDRFRFLTRIHYKSASDGKWGEHESRSHRVGCASVAWRGRTRHDARAGRDCDAMLTARHAVDYILFLKADVDVDINRNEVQATRFVSQTDLKAMFADPSLKFTPWFRLICESMLYEWWDHLDTGLDKYTDEQVIRRML